MSVYTYIENFDANLILSLPKKISLIYRNYQKKDLEEIFKIKNLCKKISRKFYISNDIKLAIKLDIDGAYIPSFNKCLNIRYIKVKKNFELIGSAHNIKEIRTKEIQNVSKIFLSPLFKTDKSNNYLGIYRFLKLKDCSNKDIICLGGIKKNNIKKLELIKPKGFAAISLFRQII